jgi:hypothetical protein
VQFNESELRVDFPHNESRIRLYGADAYDRMRGLYFDGVVLDEYGDMDPRAYPEVIRPALSDRKGWGTFIGTPKGRNAFHELIEYAEANPQDWYSLRMPVSQSKLVPDEELEDAKRMMTPEQYAQEYEVSFDAAIMGAYYGGIIAEAERAGRVTKVEPVEGIPVQTAWDLGMGNNMVLWLFQTIGNEVRIVDLIHSSGKQWDYYVGELNARGYTYGDDWVPHDARVRSLETGRTRVETLQSLGRKPRLVPDHTVEDGINAVKVSFPHFWIDKDKCAFGIEALRQYRADYDEKRKVFSNKPLHDWTSDYADAMRYLAMAWREIRPKQSAPPPKPTQVQAIVDDGNLSKEDRAAYDRGIAVGNMKLNVSAREMIEMRAKLKRMQK